MGHCSCRSFGPNFYKIIRHMCKDYHNILQDFGWTRPRTELEVLLLQRLLVLALLNALLYFQVEANGLSELFRMRLLGKDGRTLQDPWVELLSFELVPVEGWEQSMGC